MQVPYLLLSPKSFEREEKKAEKIITSEAFLHREKMNLSFFILYIQLHLVSNKELKPN